MSHFLPRHTQTRKTIARSSYLWCFILECYYQFLPPFPPNCRHHCIDSASLHNFLRKPPFIPPLALRLVHSALVDCLTVKFSPGFLLKIPWSSFSEICIANGPVFVHLQKCPGKSFYFACKTRKATSQVNCYFYLLVGKDQRVKSLLLVSEQAKRQQEFEIFMQITEWCRW